MASENNEFIPGKTLVKYAGRVYDDTERKYLQDAADEFWLTYGKWSKRLEQGLAEFLDIKHALFVNSGSSANLLAFSALTSPLLKERQIKRGDEVITVAAGFPTTVAPIVQYGAVPVFVDVDLETANIDCNMLEDALSDKTKAVMIAHTLGNPFNIDEVMLFCKKHNLWLVEDNCDALGSKWNEKCTGTFGDIGTSSFYPAHHMTTGEGGAAYTDNDLLHKIMLSMRDWGRDCWCASGYDNTCGCRFTKKFGSLPYGYDHKYVYSHFGYNLKATDLQAAIGCAQLEKLSSFIEKRKANFKYLESKLRHMSSYLKIVHKHKNADPSWFGMLMHISKDAPFTRNDLTQHLEDSKIQTRNLFAGNMLKHPCFESLKNGIDYRIVGNLENTDCIMNSFFWIGTYPGLTVEMLDYISDSFRKFFDALSLQQCM